ncbi:hypothetical protein TNIN_224561 [Trichonephila inaurata madagascariensis]|uniref:Uncharacterized protein n=1 Tax=Trichonephila inaurata madagascariensis TaxID=2747483 RepID=A0A8X6YXM5_9ARAC|nr:hypothetical protein TNIN_224561 [Trichonephila inaurata madagascariensis]
MATSRWNKQMVSKITAHQILSVQEALAILEELLSDDDSAASNNRHADEDYFENVAQGENISSDDEETDEIQCPTSQSEVKWGKLYKK